MFVTVSELASQLKLLTPQSCQSLDAGVASWGPVVVMLLDDLFVQPDQALDPNRSLLDGVERIMGTHWIAEHRLELA